MPPLKQSEARRQQAEEKLRHQLDFTRTITSSLGEGVCAIDREGRLTFMNPAAERMLGWKEAEMIGQNMHDLIHFQRADGTPLTAEECEVMGVMRSGETITDGDDLFTRRDGRMFPVAYTSSPIITDGQVVGAVLAFRDITERKRAAEEQAELTRLAALGADIGVALTQGDTLRDILQDCAEALVRHLDGAFARVWTPDETGDVLELQASAGMYTHLDGRHARVPVGRFKIGLIAEERRPHLTNTVVGDPRVSDQEWARREGMVAFAGYPLIVDDYLVGVMAMFARRALTQATLDAMASVANIVALGIERKRAEAVLREQKDTLVRLNEERGRMLEEVSTPVVPVWQGVLVLPIIGSLDTERMQRATEAALGEVVRTGAHACIIDITAARLVDSHAVANLGHLVAALRLIGAEAIVTGVTAHAARSLVNLGVDFVGLRTRRTLAEALAVLIKSSQQKARTVF
jgi:PAS domain S-box-containing protein